MKDLPENELLSAYLDGELTAAEQAEVEQLLARSPASRQLLEELRALSSKLQALPRYTLGEDVSQQVLRVAERRMLTQPSTGADIRPAGRTDMPGKVPLPAPRRVRAILRRVFSPRALVWSALAVIIAVMLTLVNRGPQQPPAHNEIAKAPAEAENRGKAPEIRAARKAGAPREESPLHKAEPALRAGTQGEGSGSGMAAEGPSLTPAPAKAGGASQPPEMKRPLSERLAVEKMEKVVPPEVAPGGPSKGGASARFGYAGGESHPTAAAQKPAPQGGPTEMGKAPDGYAMKRAAGGTGGLGRSGGGGAQPLNEGRTALTGGVLQPAGGYAVVCCDLTPAAFRAQAFQHVLALNGIALEGTLVETGIAGDAQTAAKSSVPAARQDQSGQRQLEDRKPAADRRLATLPQTGELDLVCVEAAPEQIEATLAALRSQPAEFLSVSVKPAPGVEAQKGWGRQYGRILEQRDRGNGAAPAGQPKDAAAADALAVAGSMAQKQKGVQREGKQSAGYAWRVQVPEPALRGAFSSQLGTFYGVQSGAAMQQARPGVPGPAVQQAVQPPPIAPATVPLAGPTAESRTPAEPRRTAPAPSQQPGKAPGPGEGPSKPPPAKTAPEESPGPGNGPSKGPGLGYQPVQPAGVREPFEKSSQAGSSGETMRRSASQAGTARFEEGGQAQRLGSPRLEMTPTLPSMERRGKGGQSQDRTRREAAARDETSQKLGPTPAREQREQGLKSGQPQQPVAAYRVLFVLRMVGPDVSRAPAAEASMTEQAKPPAAPPVPAQQR
jgi:hypothetical protein